MHAWPLHALMHRVFVVKSIVLLNSSFHQISKNLFASEVLIPLCLCPHIGMLIDDLIILKMMTWNDDVGFEYFKSCFLMRLMMLLSCMKAFVWILSCLLYVEYENCLLKMVWIFLGSFVIFSCPWLVMRLLN